MLQTQEYSLLDFLAEAFLQQGASVTYKNLSGKPALRITAENEPPRLFISAEEEVSKIAFLRQLTSEEIFIAVLRSEEELKLKNALARMETPGINVFRLPLQQRYDWYNRENLNKRITNTASAEAFPVCRVIGT